MIGVLKREKRNMLTLDIELCVCCGAKTDYRKETPVGKKFGYIEGAGQLCRKCFYELYGKRQSCDRNGIG